MMHLKLFKLFKLRITMHVSKENLPVTTDTPGMKMQLQMGFGGMAVAYFEMAPMNKKAAIDIFEAFPNKSCPVPHWGHMIKGSMHVLYDDGKEEVIHAGDVFYIPENHIGWSDDGMSWIEFSPENSMKEISEYT
jgi:hypothetical protein